MSLRRTSAAVLLGGVLAAGVLVGCGDDEDSGSASSATPASTQEPAPAPAADSGGAAKATAKVAIKDFKYVPATVTVKAGGSVTWTNQDTAPHNSENAQEASPPAKFTTKTPLNKGQSDTVEFAKPGKYHYYCVYHRFMEADVIVK